MVKNIIPDTLDNEAAENNNKIVLVPYPLFKSIQGIINDYISNLQKQQKQQEQRGNPSGRVLGIVKKTFLPPPADHSSNDAFALWNKIDTAQWVGQKLQDIPKVDKNQIDQIKLKNGNTEPRPAIFEMGRQK
ncbi:MAG: hypothetical protein LBH41_01740 [Rickettsiales bacterium]|jgi:hypothetical protein|nr:hypothetical protein [Rickettsiales bacterium]